MLMTRKQLYDMRGAISRMMASPQPTKLSYRLGKVLRKIHSVLAQSEIKRQELIRKHGTVAADGTSYQVQADRMPIFEDAMDKYLKDPDGKVEIEKIPYDLIANLNLTAGEMMVMDEIIESPKED